MSDHVLREGGSPRAAERDGGSRHTMQHAERKGRRAVPEQFLLVFDAMVEAVVENIPIKKGARL